MKLFQKIPQLILNDLFPITCVGCECAGRWLCPACWRELTSPTPLACLGCNREDPLGRFCRHCQPRFELLSGCWTVGEYRQPLLRQAIQVFKFEEVAALAEPLAAALSQVLRRPAITDVLRRRQVIIVPVPMDRQRERRRGFNQAALLGQRLALLVNLPYRPALAKRPRPAQVSLDEDERQRNLSGAITLTDPLAIFGKTVILIDDVVTTGATVRECATVLRSAGARSVWLLALAHG